MPQVTNVTVSRSAKINVGNYESRDCFISITVELEPTDDLEQATASAWKTAQFEVQNQIERITKGDDPMPIRGLTDGKPKFPEIGHVRKGAPKPDVKANERPRPGADLEFFRVEFDPGEQETARQFREIYGERPQAIKVQMPFDDAGRCFEAWREEYSAGGLVHRCDGEIVQYPPARRGEVCNQAACKGKPVGRLRVIVPELARFAYLTVHTTSVHDIINLSAELAAIEDLAGRLTGIPLVLSRKEKLVSTPSGPDGKRARRSKWLLHLEIDPEWVRHKMEALQFEALPELPDGMLQLENGIIDAETGEVVDGNFGVSDDIEPSPQPEPPAESAEPEPEQQADGDKWHTKTALILRLKQEGGLADKGPYALNLLKSMAAKGEITFDMSDDKIYALAMAHIQSKGLVAEVEADPENFSTALAILNWSPAEAVAKFAECAAPDELNISALYKFVDREAQRKVDLELEE